MECDGALQGVPRVLTFCGVNRQQSAYLCVDDTQFGCYGTSMGRGTGFISV